MCWLEKRKKNYKKKKHVKMSTSSTTALPPGTARVKSEFRKVVATKALVLPASSSSGESTLAAAAPVSDDVSKQQSKRGKKRTREECGLVRIDKVLAILFLIETQPCHIFLLTIPCNGVAEQEPLPQYLPGIGVSLRSNLQIFP